MSNQSTKAEDNSTRAAHESTLTVLWSLTTTLWVVGGMVGAFTSGFIADKFGRFVGGVCDVWFVGQDMFKCD